MEESRERGMTEDKVWDRAEIKTEGRARRGAGRRAGSRAWKLEESRRGG